MAEPSLGELNIAADPERGTTTPAVITDQRELVRNLMQNAQFAAQNQWNKYLNFQKNLGDFYQNAAEVQKLEVMDEDKEELQKDMVDLYETALNNPGAFSGKNPQLFGEIQSKYGSLLSKATQSKQNNLFDKANRQFIAQNNELNTDENKAIIDQNKAKPLGSRSTYSLNLPAVFDYDAYSKGLMESPTVKSTFASSEVTPDKQFIREKTGTRFSKENFLKSFDAGLEYKTDKYGQPIRKWAQERFDKLPDDLKKQIGTVDNFWHRLGEISFGSGKDIEHITKDDLQANANYLKPEELKLKKEQISQGWKRLKIAEDRLNKADDDDLIAADSALNEMFTALNNGEERKVDMGGGKVKDVLIIADPFLLKDFATIDKDGKTTKVPDEVQYDPETNQAELIYFKKKNGVVQKTASGKRIQEDSHPLTARQWSSQVVKRNNPNKDIGGVNSLIDKAMTENKNDLFKMSKAYKGEMEAKKVIGDYAPDVQEKIKSFMIKNKIKTEQEAINILKENKYLE